MSPSDPVLTSGHAFYAGLPVFERFGEVAHAEHYRPLPDDWWIGVTDVVHSTQAIAAGHYKTVNLAGATAISAVMNTLGHAPFPFVFGGDGATFAVWNDARAAVTDALARTVRMVADDLGLELRAALLPVAEVRAAGEDVRVARFQATPGAGYAMFAGGGVAWATAAMKAGRYAVLPAAKDARPDLTGLSCRWSPVAARAGNIVSLIVQPRAKVDLAAVAPVIGRVLEQVGGLAREGHPMPVDGSVLAWPPEGLELEARVSRREGQSVAARRAELLVATLYQWILNRTGWTVLGFDPAHYRRTTVRNADFRKFDDGLRLTIDCDDATLARIEDALRGPAADGLIDYGIHRQGSALMTCIVPSAVRDDHLHFIDGADGGYTRAAEAIKANQAARERGG